MPVDANPPHCYAAAERTFQDLWKPGALNQAIVITGESGAGKSFSTNRILDYLSAIGRDMKGPRPPCFREPPIKASDLSFAEKTITDKLLTSTAIVEAFGNAKMVRNNDSSRFGKLYKIFFEKKNHYIQGCSIQPYLLEKSRVTQQANGERNYHIFYELLAGLSGAEKKRFHAKACSAYAWLNTPGVTPTYEVEDEDGIKDDGAELVGVRDALSNFCPGNEDNVFGVTLGVLTLGDIKITEEKDNAVIASGDAALNEVAELFGVSPGKLSGSIVSQSLKIGSKVQKIPVSKVTATKFCGSIGKVVYNEMFVWLVHKCSEDLVKDVPLSRDKTPSLPFIGVLDIFGFEFTKEAVLLDKERPDKNSFEQWCINGCNEKLQQFFVSIIVDLENKLYTEELGKPLELNFKRNDDTLDLIFAKKKSLYAQLENTTMLAGRSTDPNATFDEDSCANPNPNPNPNPNSNSNGRTSATMSRKSVVSTAALTSKIRC